MTQPSEKTSPAMIELPEKTYFKIGEVAKLLDVEPYVLRYWETEFDTLEPEKTKSGQRVYQRHDIEHLLEIKELLYVEMFTIAGARRQLERGGAARLSGSVAGPAGSVVSADEELLAELTEARRELAEAQHALHQARESQHVEEQRLLTAQRALEDERDALGEELQQAHAQLAAGGEVDAEETLRLEQEIEALREELARERRRHDEVSEAGRRIAEEREQRRRRVLSQMRREVESLAVLADINRARR